MFFCWVRTNLRSQQPLNPVWCQVLKCTQPLPTELWRNMFTPFQILNSNGDSCGNRTRVAGVRGRSLNRLTNEPFFKGLIVVSPLLLVHHQGLEPGTPWLRVRCSTNWANGAYFFYGTDKSEIRLLSVSRLKSSSFLTFRSRALRYLDFPFVVRLKRSLLPHPFGQVPWKLNKEEINWRVNTDWPKFTVHMVKPSTY